MALTGSRGAARIHPSGRSPCISKRRRLLIMGTIEARTLPVVGRSGFAKPLPQRKNYLSAGGPDRPRAQSRRDSEWLDERACGAALNDAADQTDVARQKQLDIPAARNRSAPKARSFCTSSRSLEKPCFSQD